MEAPIHRVISESEDVCNMETEAIEHDSVRGGETDNINEPSPMEGVQTEFASPASHVVEPEISKNEEGAPFTLVHSRSEDAASSSSLSDGSEPDTTKDDEDMKPSPKPPKPAATPDSATPKKMQRMERNNLIRMDSAANDSSSAASHRQSSQNSSRDWGWFEDVHQSTDGLTPSEKKSAQKRKAAQQGTESPQQNPANSAMAVTAPPYVLEESLSSQRLWKVSAGTRPPQPMEERAFFEKLWTQNFARSHVDYKMPVDVLTAASPVALSPFADGVFEGNSGESVMGSYIAGDQDHDHRLKADAAEAALTHMGGISDDTGDAQVKQRVRGSGSDDELTVILRGPNAFGTTVSKSFAKSSVTGGPLSVDTINISLASYRVVESKEHGKYAQFLVIYREGSIRDTVGVWKRYRHFEELANKVTHAHEGCAAVIANMSPLAMTEETETEHLPNAITSWRLLQKRKRWYRCLDSGYLSLKVFLLERFLHDILFESSNPQLLRDFVLGDSD